MQNQFIQILIDVDDSYTWLPSPIPISQVHYEFGLCFVSLSEIAIDDADVN